MGGNIQGLVEGRYADVAQAKCRRCNPGFSEEVGPPPYAITDGKQLELSDRWEEALQIKGWAEQIWAELEAETD